MWIAVIGGIGTCKGAVSDFLVGKDFSLNKIETTSDLLANNAFSDQFYFLLSRYKQAEAIKKRVNDYDFVSVRSFWDTGIWTDFYRQKFMLDDINFEILKRLYNDLLPSLSPPQCFIYLKNSILFSQVRTSLSDSTKHSDEDIKLIADLYDDFVKRVRLPVIEIDVNQSFDNVTREVVLGIDSIKTSSSFAQSIWERRIF